MRGRLAHRHGAESRVRVLLVPVLLAGMLVVAGAASGSTIQRPPIEKELPALAPGGDDALTRALQAGDLTEAEYALERALAAFDPERARALYGIVERPGPREATTILRDLAARVAELPPGKRALAERVLARPTQRTDAIRPYRAKPRRTCSARMCFWWVTKTRDAPPLADRNRNRLPDWVETTRSVFGTVWKTEVRLFGYRRPLSDLRSRSPGPNGKLDIYIADVGADGFYGYCTTDDPARRFRRAVSSYCVVDDDFARRQFDGAASGLRALRITAAHEFFHAIQYGYDWLEDLWLMEGTATWIEDEVYDRVNDNRQYLRTSPLSARFFWYPLDYYNPDPNQLDAGFKYGAWIYWRYLSERFGRDVVRAVWARANARGRARNEYSTQAVIGALAARGQNFADIFADFGVANLFPRAAYAEGGGYPVPRPTRVLDVTPAGVPRTRVPTFHLSSDYYGFVPSGVPAGSWLTITLELPDPATSPRASALVSAAGAITRVPAAFDGTTGRWTISVADFASVRRVVLVLTNASTRFACWRRSVFSCRGRPLDDVDYYFQASVTTS